MKLADALGAVPGVKVMNETFFNEFTIETPKPGAEVIDALVEKGVLGGVPLSRLMPGNDAMKNLIAVASTEVNSDQDRAAYARALKEVLA